MSWKDGFGRRLRPALMESRYDRLLFIDTPVRRRSRLSAGYSVEVGSLASEAGNRSFAAAIALRD
jgi:hypothetical protein